jgi:Fur family transcriptional regulator, zinc uptake regulator
VAQELKLTKNQSLVLDELQNSEAPLSAYHLFRKLRPHGFSAALQVYRALEKLLETGLVHRLDSINAFMACTHSEGHHHGHSHATAAFAICETCGQVNEFTDEMISDRLFSWAKANGFHTTKTGIELHGRCAACQV